MKSSKFKTVVLEALIFSALFLGAITSNAQVGIGIMTADPSAQLDVTSTKKGFLAPRMTMVQRDSIAIGETPATGLLIYQTDNTPGFYYYNGSAWVAGVGPAGPLVTATMAEASLSGASGTYRLNPSANNIYINAGSWISIGTNNSSGYFYVTNKDNDNTITIVDTGFGVAWPVNATVALVGRIGAAGVAGPQGPAGNDGSNATISMGAIGTATPNGATITAGVLSLAPADATNGGIVTAADQVFGGVKTFNNNIVANGTVGVGTTTPSPSAKLEVSSTTQGFLPPRMTEVQKNAIVNPGLGLIIYCTDCGSNGGEPECYNGSAWVSMFGLQGSLPTLAPTNSTSSITTISFTSAASGGNILADGGVNVYARGVCWNTSSNPSISLSTKTYDGTGIGSFTSSITGLTDNTTYYVRSYATNVAGTAYGNEVVFTTVTAGTIGTQVWTTQNLDVSAYRDGTPIPQITNATEWANTTQGAWCYYNNDPANALIYGKLYNWYAVNDNTHGGLAPAGYHIPTDGEWTTLTTTLGADASTQMKSTTGWNSDGNGTNTFGFAGLPGGSRISNGIFPGIGDFGYWWSSTEDDITYAWGGSLNSNSFVNRNIFKKTGGFSVRCLRD